MLATLRRRAVDSLVALAVVIPAAPFGTLAAQATVPVRDLPRASHELDDPYSLVAIVREGGRGQVAVIDAMDGEVTLVNFETGERVPLGRQGAGPGEYRMPSGLFRVRGDTLWVFDPAQQRVTVFLPDRKPGIPFRIEMLDTQARTVLAAPFLVDDAGRMYSGSMPIPVGAGGAGGLQIPDSVSVIRFDPRGTGPRTVLGSVRIPTSGKPEMRVEGQVMHYKFAFPGFVTADAWAAFPDGRVAIVHGATYTVEMITADGKRTTSAPVAYDRIPVTAEDRTAELTDAKRQMAEQLKAAQRSMPAGFSLDVEMTPPASWPSHYPAIAPMMVHAAPDGRLWVRRATPSRVGREQWDVLDAQGVLVARWRLPARTKLMGVGAGVVYTVRLDQDDLQFLQRVEVGR